MSAEKLTSRLSLLQNKIKRDPAAYKNEFELQHRHFQTEYELFMLKPMDKNMDFCALISFLSAVTPCYPQDMIEFPTKLMKLIETHDTTLHPKVRFSLTKCLTMLRNRGYVSPVPLLTLFFKLFRIHDKALRKLLFSHIISDITNINEKGDNQKVNRAMQNFMFTMIEDRSDIASRKSLDVIVDLYCRHIWIDARTVNVLSTACLSDKVKVAVGALRFFLGIEERIAGLEEEKEMEEETRIEHMKAPEKRFLHSKKTKKKERLIEKQNKKVKTLRKRLHNQSSEPRFLAIELIYDPQSFAEKLFAKLKGSKDRFEMKIMMMNLISRCIGHHSLILLPLYSFMQRYLTSHQTSVTEILACLVQSCHELIPPEELVPIVRTIANNFVTDRNSPEVIAVGINSIREIFRRVPLTLDEDGIKDLVHDLVQYQTYRERGVRSSSRALVNLLREIYPDILRTKDRGKFNNKGAKPAQYGTVKVHDGVEGAELLAEEEDILQAAGLMTVQEERHGEDAWEEASDESEDESGWVKIDHSSDEEEEEEETNAEAISRKKRKRGDQQSDSEGADEDEEEEEEEASRPHKRIDQHRILTPADFERIKELKDRKQRQSSLNGGDGDDYSDDEDRGNLAIVAPGDLESLHKQRRRNLEERLAKAREGREEFVSKQKGGGTTNREKNRKKNFNMVKKSDHVRAKLKQTLMSKQNAVNKRVKALSKLGKNMTRRRT